MSNRMVVWVAVTFVPAFDSYGDGESTHLLTLLTLLLTMLAPQNCCCSCCCCCSIFSVVGGKIDSIDCPRTSTDGRRCE